MTPEELAEIRERADKATPGPWREFSTGPAHGDHWYVTADGESIALIHANDGIDEEARQPDAEFIAAARAYVPRLLDEIERLQTANRDWVPKIRKLEAKDGAAELTLTEAHEVVEGITAAFAKMLDDVDAVNYIECEMKAAGGPRYLFTIQRYRKPTPHELRKLAEAKLVAALEIHEAHIGRPGGRIETDCVCVGCEIARALKGGR
jgi:hypothetical protein